nr:hypothetical protein [Arthrospira sp. SH-MAG29]
MSVYPPTQRQKLDSLPEETAEEITHFPDKLPDPHLLFILPH